MLRNVILNCGDEPIKLKSLGGTDEPSGVLIHHNTFVSSRMALNLQTPITQRNFVISNNLFVGPKTLAGARTAEWTAKIENGRFDRNGWFPNGGFWLGVMNGSNLVYQDFAAMKAAAVVEKDGTLLNEPLFASGLVAPATSQPLFAAKGVALADGSNAIDAAEPIDGINDGWLGKAADLGAIEKGCDEPLYGPRPIGQDEVIAPIRCTLPPPGGADGGTSSSPNGVDGGGANGPGANGDPSSGAEDNGCGCRLGGAPVTRIVPAALVLLLGASILRRRRS